MLYGCPFDKIHFLPKIDTNSGFERDWDTLWSKSSNDGIWPQKMSNSMHGIKSATLENANLKSEIVIRENKRWTDKKWNEM